MNIAIGTKNKAKIKAVQTVVSQYFQEVKFESIDVPSNVSEQPFSNEETRQGAINRAINTLQCSNADISFGLEGGVMEIENKMYCTNWGAIALQDGTIISASGATFLLPEMIAKELKKGKELGPVMDEFTKQKDTRQHDGAIGVFTNHLIDRAEMFEHIVKILIGQYFYEKNHE